MIVKSLDGRESKLKLRSNNYNGQSQLHQQALLLIQKSYPFISVYEEVPIDIKNGKTLYLDIFIPKFDIAIEIHGEQHFKFIPHFHQTKAAFYRSQQNDRLKKEWCELNNIQLIELKYDDNIEQWNDKLRQFT